MNLKSIDKRLVQIEEESKMLAEEKEKLLREQKLKKNEEQLEKLRKHREAILDIFEHDTTSCSDDNVCNGVFQMHTGLCSCRKCALIEILDGKWGNDYEVSFSINILKVE